MILNVKVQKDVSLKQYCVLRGIREKGLKKEVVAEKVFETHPSPQDIAEFLSDTKVDFCSVITNYRLYDDDELPFF